LTDFDELDPILVDTLLQIGRVAVLDSLQVRLVFLDVLLGSIGQEVGDITFMLKIWIFENFIVDNERT
jgi:hypothetical protein